jgi:hypothetical protein
MLQERVNATVRWLVHGLWRLALAAVLVLIGAAIVSEILD